MVPQVSRLGPGTNAEAIGQYQQITQLKFESPEFTKFPGLKIETWGTWHFLECVDQIELEAVEVWFDRTSCNSSSLNRILQVCVQSTTMPPSKTGYGVGTELP
jgi:hypothetical protein